MTANALDEVSAQAFFATSKSTGPISPQHLNRYSYANNDPLTHIDPNGHIPATCFYCTWPNFIWQWGTQLLGLESEVDIYDMPFAAQVGANLLCVIAPCKIENGTMKALTYGDMQMASVAMIGTVGLTSPICPGCGMDDPLLLRSRGNIATYQHIKDLAAVGKDGISAFCDNCTGGILKGNFYGPRTIDEIRAFAQSIGLDPEKAALYTPEFGGKGHYSLFVDAFGDNGRLLPMYADEIAEFLSQGPNLNRR